ncbi:MAG: hypothetical protein U0790_10945 [Isosphaeraceae bacterium]
MRRPGGSTRDLPDVVCSVGYARPESMAAARWARSNGAASILMSESQAIDRPRTWWKERIKRRRLRFFDAAACHDARARDYLVELGMSAGRIALGYNAVDNAFYEERTTHWRSHREQAGPLLSRPSSSRSAGMSPRRTCSA